MTWRKPKRRCSACSRASADAMGSVRPSAPAKFVVMAGSAGGGETGLDLARERKPDVIVMDISLPGANGFEALKRLREMEQTRHVPVIALTANAMPGDVARGARAGFHRHLTKPVRVEELLAAIEDALEGVS
jgi:CheY-like chemotaxis protein